MVLCICHFAFIFCFLYDLDFGLIVLFFLSVLTFFLGLCMLSECPDFRLTDASGDSLLVTCGQLFLL